MRRAMLGLSLLVAGCGGGGDTGVVTNETAPAPTAAVTVTTQEDTAQAAPTPTGDPEFRVQLTGESPQATVGRPWRYTVRATALSGGPANGTAKMRIFVDDELVDTLGFFSFEGTLSRTHRWQSVLRGKSGVVLQAEVEGAGGTVRVNYPVTVN